MGWNSAEFHNPSGHLICPWPQTVGGFLFPPPFLPFPLRGAGFLSVPYPNYGLFFLAAPLTKSEQLRKRNWTYEIGTFRRGHMPKDASFAYASWLNIQLSIRKISVGQLYMLVDQKIPKPRIWKWLRGEGAPKYWEGLLIGERLQSHPDYSVVRNVNTNGAEVKDFQTYFPGHGPRKKAKR